MRLTFEWDEEKARTNLKKHRISFDEATTVFADPYGKRECRNGQRVLEGSFLGEAG
ncbi:MAG: BrnT family toxin [Sedimentisphaerales bacterium]|nr:BrnT family toxin [Sedimentisphaerales bacterium]